MNQSPLGGPHSNGRQYRKHLGGASKHKLTAFPITLVQLAKVDTICRQLKISRSEAFRRGCALFIESQIESLPATDGDDGGR